MTALHSHHRTSLAIGWEAARANLAPALLIQAAMLALLIGYYWSPAVARILNELAEYKLRHGLAFVVLAAVAAGRSCRKFFSSSFSSADAPLAATCATCCSPFRSGRSTVRWSICFTGARRPGWATWSLSRWCWPRFASINSATIHFLPRPLGVLTYEWKNSGLSLESLVRAFTWSHYRDKIVPTLLATWAVWIPLMAIIYSLPLALQFPLFSLALTFWVLLLTYMTNSFAAKNTRVHRASDVVSPAMAGPIR